MDKKMSAIVSAISNIVITPPAIYPPDIYLDAEKVSDQLDRISGNNLTLYRRFNG